MMTYSLPSLHYYFPHLHLQTIPEARPSLEQILQHSFFTRSGISTPSQLPESALRDVPVFPAFDAADSTIGKKIGKVPTEVFVFIFLSHSCHILDDLIYILNSAF
jgi:hypothetical protein